ncbi:hypothetical protein C6503_01920 [Candidatus Poribacteria bacterium]|nr:MAG: hypothetical protein C6503_01920 [Candidatus Poribacteria bacterium]
MKTIHPFFITLLMIVGIPLISFAEDNTKVGLPEGAIARLGKGGINIMRFSPDGTRLVVGTDVGAWVYDVPDGKETALFTGHTGQVNALAFSQDGKTFASGGFVNPVIQVWDVETKSKRSTVPLTREPYSLPALTFYGEILISTNGNREITYWHADTGQKLSESRLDNPINRVTFSQDGSTLAIGDRNGRIQLWDTTTSSQQADLEGHGGGRDSEILALTFSPDGKMLASGSEDKTVRLWDTQNHTKLGTLIGHTGWVTAVAFSEDGNTVASGDASKTIKLWDLDTQQERATITGHKNTINALAFAPVGTPLYGMCLASGSTDGTIRFWNPLNGEELITFTSGHTESVKAVAFSENGTTLTTAAFNGIVDVWSLQTGRELITFTDSQCDAADVIALSPDATYFVREGQSGLIAFKPDGFGHRSSLTSNSLQLWEIATEAEIPGPWQDIGNSASKSIFSPVHGILAVSSHKDIQAWHMSSGDGLFIFDARWSPRTDPVFSPDGKWLATIERSGKAQVWNVEAPNEPAIISTQKAAAMAFSPDSTTLAIATGGHICLWEFRIEAEDKLTFIRGGLRGFKNILTFSPDGTTLVGSDMEGWSNPIKLWDVETRRGLGMLSGHTEPIETLVFSHDGKTLASGSQDGTVLLWDWDKIIAKGVPDNK